MSFKKKTVATAIAMTLGTVGAVSTASAGSLVLTFTNNASATANATNTDTSVGNPGLGGQAGFAAGSEFHVATPYGTALNDGDKDIIKGGETWTFSNALSSSSAVSMLMTAVSGTDKNTGFSGANGVAKVTNGQTGYPVSSAAGSSDTIGVGADFLGAGNFTILAPLTGNATGQTFGAGHITAFDQGAGTFNVHFPVLYVQWADGGYIIGGDGDGNGTHTTNQCAVGGPCPGPGVNLAGTLDGAGNFTLSGNQTMTKDEVTVGGFNKNIVEFALTGSYALTLDHAPAAVPVPAAAWLFGSGLMGMVGVARRRRNKKA